VQRTPHDALFKAGFESPSHAAALFRQMLPAELADVIDWQTIRREAGSFVDPELASRHTDLLFSVRAPGQDENTRLLLYLLVEHQSTNDPAMPLRMLVYLVRIWEAYHKLHGAPLPLIVPAVVSHAPEGWSAPTSFHALFEPPPDAIPHLARLVPSFSFLLTDLVRTSNEELRRWVLPPFASVVLRYLRDARHFDQLRESLPEWIGPLERLARGPERNLAALEQLLRYIARVTGELRFHVFRAMIISHIPEAEEVTMTVAEELRAEGEAKGRAQGRAEGRSEGHAEGRLQGRVETLEKQMTLKFGALSAEHAALIDSATEQQLDVYIERILTATSPTDVFAGAQ
jgi:predicted transposase YdaD